LLELLEVDLAIAVHIDLFDDFLPDTFVSCSVLSKDSSDLGRINSATVIIVEELECSSHV